MLSPSCIHLYTKVLRVQSEDGQYDGHEWQSIEGIDLNTGLTETITMSDGIGIESSLEKTWISTLHGANADGSELYCTLAYEKR